MSDNPFLLLAAKLRGWLDGINLAFKLFGDKTEFSASDAKQITGGSGNLYLPGGQEERFRKATEPTSWENTGAGER
jgi:hypothetical protein